MPRGITTQVLDDANFSGCGICYSCGEAVKGKNSHFCPGHDTSLLPALLTNPVTRLQMTEVMERHIDSLR